MPMPGFTWQISGEYSNSANSNSLLGKIECSVNLEDKGSPVGVVTAGVADQPLSKAPSSR